MPRQRQQREQQSGNSVPFYFSNLSTRRSSYPTWVVIRSSPAPQIVKRSDLGIEVAQLLIRSNRALPVPPFVNDIASALSWLVDTAPAALLLTCYRPIQHNLLYVCDRNCNHHIHLVLAHRIIASLCMTRLLLHLYPENIYTAASEAVDAFITTRWGDAVHFAGFTNVLLDSYIYVKNNYGDGNLLREP